MSTKGELRRHYRALLAAKPNAAAASQQIGQRLADWLLAQPDLSGSAWAGYQPLPDEPDLTSTFQSLTASSFSFAYPAIEGERLRFYHVDEESHWTAGPWSLREPHREHAREVSVDSLAGVLVPGLAFDRRGFRLGRGKGYYDRALESFKGIKVGVAYSEQLASELPADAHDVRMDYIITENGVLDSRAGEMATRGVGERKAK